MPDWMEEVPDNAQRLIRSASLMVESATRMDYYNVDDEGKPTDMRIIEAFKYATLAQVSFWDAAKLDPAKGATGQTPHITSQSVPGGSVSYGGTQSTQELGRAATSLCSEAVEYLRTAGLLRGHVRYKC